VCDSRVYKCTHVHVVGSGFYNTDQLSCSFQSMKVSMQHIVVLKLPDCRKYYPASGGLPTLNLNELALEL